MAEFSLNDISQENTTKIEREYSSPKSEIDKAIKLIPDNPEIIGNRNFETTKKECFISFKETPFEGTEIKPGQAIIITLPEDITSKVLDSVTLKHRKSSKYESSISADGWDSQGSYTRILIFDDNKQEWISWPDPYKGRTDISRGDKYAEPREASNPENEVLYDWISKVGKINPKYIAVIGVGKGEMGVVNYHGIEVDCFPEKLESKLELIFSPGTKFVDSENNSPTYGGGMQHRGKYPKSVPLNNYEHESITFPITTEGDDFYLDKSQRLHIKINKDTDISRLEVAVGDTEDTGELNKDGHYGRLGWAKLNAFIQKTDGSLEQIMDTLNVPPNGVLKGSPEKTTKLNKGDEIIIASNRDAAYVMGVRIQ